MTQHYAPSSRTSGANRAIVTIVTVILWLVGLAFVFSALKHFNEGFTFGAGASRLMFGLLAGGSALFFTALLRMTDPTRR
ncbi:hypothetical protein CYG49_04605 [Candidatus Saccharibacteria bacterium]|nr:MAG: hypothetical protein CYG49_04605 [Candidatus Saccharibacteria bacterium]